MSEWHCRKCHHEWEGSERACDWCGADEPILLAEKTPLAILLEQMFTPDGAQKE